MKPITSQMPLSGGSNFPSTCTSEKECDLLACIVTCQRKGFAVANVCHDPDAVDRLADCCARSSKSPDKKEVISLSDFLT